MQHVNLHSGGRRVPLRKRLGKAFSSMRTWASVDRRGRTARERSLTPSAVSGSVVQNADACLTKTVARTQRALMDAAQATLIGRFEVERLLVHAAGSGADTGTVHHIEQLVELLGLLEARFETDLEAIEEIWRVRPARQRRSPKSN